MSTNITAVCSVEVNFGIYIVYITGFISLFTICECLTVIIVVWRTDKFHGNTHIFVASLAVNDLIFAVVFFFNQVTVVPLFWSETFKSNLMVNVVYGVSSGTSNLSIVHMGIMAIDRYIHIVHPFYYTKNVTVKRSLIFLMCLWILEFCNMIFPAVIYADKRNEASCILAHQPAVFYCLGVFLYFATFITVFICYFKIALVAFKHKKAALARRAPVDDGSGEILVRKYRMAAMRSVKFFALMFGIFSLCTVPPFMATGIDFLYPLSGNITVGLYFLIPIDSIINFLIYVNMNKEFSKELKKMLSSAIRRCCKRRNQL